MRLLIVTGIFPPDAGGPATYVPQIAAALAERGHRVTVLTLSDGADHEDARHMFRVVRMPRRQLRLIRLLRTIFAMLKLGWESDLLFINGLAMEATLANVLLRKPMVQKIVGDLAWEWSTNKGWVRDGFEEFQQNRYSTKIEVLKKLRAWWTRQADRVIVPSRYLAHWVARWGVPAGRIVVIYNAVESFRDTRPSAVPLSTSLKIATVGRLVPWKHVDGLIEALTQVEDAGLVIVGDGPERASLESLAQRLNLDGGVFFAGYRSKSDTFALMAGCDLFVLNSTYEGLPHVVLEAMSVGLPVIATAVGGTPEVVRHGETGLLIQSNLESLVEAIQRLRSDPALRRRMGQEGREMVHQRFSHAAMVEQTCTVLRSVCSDQRNSLVQDGDKSK